MASALLPRPLLALALLLSPLLAAAAPALEDGYAVSTFADLSRLPPSGPHPYAILPRPRAGDLVLLDSAGSALYTLALSSPYGDPRRLAGGEAAGLDRPRSVAVDAADNVYVADRARGAVRKVAPSGLTTTIVGGLSSGPGHRDGKAQNATFSPDFELVYVPKICALLVADRGNRLIRQINLKPEDCAQERQPGLGTTPVSIIAILCALLGSVIGFSVRHFYPVHEVCINRLSSRMKTQCKRTRRKAILISFCDIKSAVVSSMFYTLLLKVVRVSRGYLTVVIPNVRLERGVPSKPFPHLNFHKTESSHNIDAHSKALGPTEQLSDLISFDGDAGDTASFDGDAGDTVDNGNANSQDGDEPSFNGDLIGLFGTPPGSIKKIDQMIKDNISDFFVQDDCRGLCVNSYGVSRRRSRGDN